MAAFVIGGTSNPLYSLLIAYTNDYLDPDDMAAASGGLIFINGMGAITGPLVTGWVMDRFGAQAFFGMIALLMLIACGLRGLPDDAALPRRALTMAPMHQFCPQPARSQLRWHRNIISRPL